MCIRRGWLSNLQKSCVIALLRHRCQQFTQIEWVAIACTYRKRSSPSLTERYIYGVTTCSGSKSHLPLKADETCRSAQRTWYTVGKQRTKLGPYPRSCVQIGPVNGVLLDLQKYPSSYLIWPRHFVASLSREEGSKSSLRSLSAVKVKFDWSTCGESSLLLILYAIASAVSAQFHDKEIPENKENRLPKTLLHISRAYNIL